MRRIFLIIITLTLISVSCSHSERYRQILSDAERIVHTNPDSALTLINDIEPADIKTDSLKALYYLVKASIHKEKENSMASDSLVRFSFEYYKNRDRNRFAQSADFYALHQFWVGERRHSLELLDSMISLKDIPDRLMIGLLQSRMEVGGAGFD